MRVEGDNVARVREVDRVAAGLVRRLTHHAADRHRDRRIPGHDHRLAQRHHQIQVVSRHVGPRRRRRDRRRRHRSVDSDARRVDRRERRGNDVAATVGDGAADRRRERDSIDVDIRSRDGVPEGEDAGVVARHADGIHGARADREGQRRGGREADVIVERRREDEILAEPVGAVGRRGDGERRGRDVFPGGAVRRHELDAVECLDRRVPV